MDFTAGRVIASQQFERMSKGINHSFGIVTGGVVSTSANITVAISAVAARDYVINGAVQTTAYAGGTLALTTAHASLPRIDSIYIDTSGAVGKVDGTAATVPKPPEINDTTQLLLANVYVAANDTTLAASDIEDKRQLILPHTAFLPPFSSSGTINAGLSATWPGTWSLGNTGADGTAGAAWVVPTGFIGLRRATAFFHSDSTANAVVTVTAQWAAHGEPRNTHSDTTLAIQTVACVASQMIEYDIITNLDVASLTAGDVVGINLNRLGTNGSDTISIFYFHGFRLEWY